MVTGSATATSRAWTEVSEGRDGMGERGLTLSGGIARADSGHDCFFVVCTRVRSREKKAIVLDRGGWERER